MPTVHYANRNFLKQNNLHIDWSIDETGLERSASFVDEKKQTLDERRSIAKSINTSNLKRISDEIIWIREGKAEHPAYLLQDWIDTSSGSSSDSSIMNNMLWVEWASNGRKELIHKHQIVKGGLQERKRHRPGYLSPTPDPSKAFSNSNTSSQQMQSGGFNYKNDSTTLDKKQKSWPLRGVKELGNNDCLLGRGSGVNHHPGNKRYRQLIAENRATYNRLPRSDKGTLTVKIVKDWRAQDPPGRFLKINEETQLWDDVGDEKARAKVSQSFISLREKRAEMGSKKREGNVSLSTMSRSRSDSSSTWGTQTDQQPTASDDEDNDAFSSSSSSSSESDDDSYAGGVDTSKRKRGKCKSFEQRLEDLKAYKRKHGHVHVTFKEDKALYQFCAQAKYSLQHPEKAKTKMTNERIASFSALGFPWAKQAYNKNKSTSDKLNISEEESQGEWDDSSVSSSSSSECDEDDGKAKGKGNGGKKRGKYNSYKSEEGQRRLKHAIETFLERRRKNDKTSLRAFASEVDICYETLKPYCREDESKRKEFVFVGQPKLVPQVIL